MRRLAVALASPFSGYLYATDCALAQPGFEDCQALAISRGVPSRYTDKVEGRYLRYKAAGKAIHPKGQIARCMSGRS